ncbi:MAG TPA: AtpZ/AtpI family protein [Nitrosospira sp.]|nr:AtpZ/AtpI family protein [Nitrosospira sp.]
MNDSQEKKTEVDEPEWSRAVGVSAARKLKAQREKPDADRAVWSGLSMMGLVGWSVVVPTLLGAGLGVWLDRRYPTSHSWTLALLLAGLIVGCFNAWYWVTREDRETHKQRENGEGDSDE